MRADFYLEEFSYVVGFPWLFAALSLILAILLISLATIFIYDVESFFFKVTFERNNNSR